MVTDDSDADDDGDIDFREYSAMRRAKPDGAKLSEAQLQKVVVTLPQVLGLSYEANLEPKLAFLEAELGFPL
ncbi:MAG: hypothetical protein VXW43_19745, partial [Pseudomonadota bacterium]|nr:hypothetical protein [Pseudomonadota bacterium]